MELKEFFEKHPKTALGFSGGVDSAYLLYAGVKCGADIRPYYIKTQFTPRFEYEDAKRLCDELETELSVIEYDILSDENARKNASDRCYHCKRAIFSALKERASRDGYTVIIDGTNASDDLNERPGARAMAELEVLSPLRLCGLTKDEIRARSKEAGLFTYNKPSYSCLATRVQTGTELTEEILKRVEGAETELFGLGFTDFRARVFHGAMRLQVRQEQLLKAVNTAPEIRERVSAYFDTVLLDLTPRK